MIIKNDFVKIKTDKAVILHNYIYDEYLKAFSQSQYVTDISLLNDLNSKKTLEIVYIKFDTKLVDYKKAQKSDFDLSICMDSMQKETNSKSINAYYNYSMQLSDIKRYKNKKITALGFGNYEDVLACVDTSNYSIYVADNEKMEIIRKDIFSSDIECVGYDYPVHLAPQRNYTTSNACKYNEPLALLYSAGLGFSKGVIEEEKIIEEHPIFNMLNINQISDTEFGINLKRDAELNIYPNINFFGAMGKMPTAFFVEHEIFPNQNICTGNKQPLPGNYQYIILKYQLYHFDNSKGGDIVMEKENKFYTMNIPLQNKKGLFELRTKIERRN